MNIVDIVNNLSYKTIINAKGYELDDPIDAGGPGSGCKGSNCGRKRTKDQGRQARALSSYNPVTKEKFQQATNNEANLAKAIGGDHIGDHAPFDVIVKNSRIAFEVKTIIAGKKNAITMHKSSRERKLKAWKSMKLKMVYTVIFDDRNNKIYIGEGVKSFRLTLRSGEKNPSLKEIDNIKDIKRFIK